MTTLDDELAVKTAPARAPKGRKHAPSQEAERLQGLAPPLVVGVRRRARLSPSSACSLTLFYVYSQLELPKTPPPLQTTYIYDRTAHQIATLHSRRGPASIIPLSDMPLQLQHAVIAVEDKGFYQHPGIDVTGVFRAAWTDLVSGEIVQGGSTLTQQLVKNVYAGEYSEDPKTGVETYVVPPRTLGQKVRESLLAIKVEREFTKDEILAKYLNTIYFGRGAYGVQAAAQTYFQKDASELSRSSRRCSPAWSRAPRSTTRSSTSRRRRSGATTSSNRWRPRGISPPSAQPSSRPGRSGDPIEVGLNFPGKLGYFLDYTRRDLIDRNTEAQVFGGGLQVTTTLDPQMQVRRRGGRRDPPAHAGRPRGGGRRDRPSQKVARPRDVRGEELRDLEGEPRDRRRRLGTPGRVGVQAVHARHGDGAGLLAERPLARPGLDHDPGPRGRHERRPLGPLERGRRGER